MVSAAVAEPAVAATHRSRTRRAPALGSVVLPGARRPGTSPSARPRAPRLAGAHGAVVAMDPRTGRVPPVVNPRSGSQRAYQPCSVFKIVVAIAGLSEGVITPDTTYHCTSGCWMWAGHGPIDLRPRARVSCNPYFEWVGEQLGYERVQRYAHLLGLGEPSGINLTGETAGFVSRCSCAPTRWDTSRATRRASRPRRVQLAVLISATRQRRRRAAGRR